MEKIYKILVAEDEQFQRFALLDLLIACDYQVVAVENGNQAMDALKNENDVFDLVLLDLYMPEMDGFEVLYLMKESERLKQIPIVVMSSTESNEIISDCLKSGAIDFLVKPVRSQHCKALKSFMKSSGSGRGENEEKGLARYEKIRSIGKGATGMVDLVMCKETGEQYALKTMDLQYMNPKERKSAECEVEFLRVIIGPTIIKFTESFIENQNIYILMEYAEGGNLSEMIARYKRENLRFTEDQILMYTAQLTLSLLALHSKQVLHRDVKSQNIFIKKGVLKLGDFGISKALQNESDLLMTKCGTPYFMPPEVCQDKPYDVKADVWSLGVIVYELITLKKPFEGTDFHQLFQAIIHKPLDPLPDDCSSDLQLLIKALLNKNKEQRSSIFDIA